MVLPADTLRELVREQLIEPIFDPLQLEPEEPDETEEQGACQAGPHGTGVLLLGVALVGVIGVRLARVKGVMRTGKRCDACGRSEPSTSLRFFKNTGMLIMFRSETAGGQLCRSCGLDLGMRMTLWTLALGWWGMISFFVNILFVANNFGNLLWALTLPSGAAVALRGLEEHREYALNLLATKDFDDVVYVLRQTSGASTEAVRAYLEGLRATAR